MATDTGVFLYTATSVGGATIGPIDIGKLKDVCVQIKRTSGSTDTATVEVSNDKTNWVTATSRKDSGTGQGALSGITDAIDNVLENARWLRVVSSGTTDPFDVSISAPSARG